VPSYRPAIPPQVADVIRHLPPSVKRAVRAAIRALTDNPAAGEPLHGKLEGRFKYRVRRFRLVYGIDREHRIVRILSVGHRRSIYEELAERSSGDG
jgi:mRNA interferase RelE/StbE